MPDVLVRLLELYRGRTADEQKARQYVAARAARAFREAVADYDAFVPFVGEIPEPALFIGTARDSFDREIAVRLPFEQLACHALIQGATGSGKTTFITWLVANALRAAVPIGTLDCKSGFHEAAIAWAAAIAYRLPPGAREAFIRRLVVADPFGDNNLIPFNLCRVAPGATVETQSYDLARILARLFDTSMGVQMETALIHLLQLLMEAELTLVEAPLVLQDEVLRGVLAERSRNPAVRAYFARWEQVPASSREALLTRLQAFLLPENLRLMLGADELIDFRRVFDEGRPLFVYLGMGPGVPTELVELFGSLILQFLLNSAVARGRGGRPYILAGDEFFHLLGVPVLAQRFERGLDTLREFGLHLALVLHRLDQVPGSLREALLQQAEIMAVFRTSGRYAMHFADALPESDPEVVAQSLRRTGRLPGKHEVRSQLVERLARLPNRHCWWWDRRKPYPAILIRVADVPAPHQAIGISGRELEAFIQAHAIRAGGLALPKEALRRQIAERHARLRELVRPPIRVVSAPASTAGPQRPRLG